jgi:hypothetical protein
VTVFTGSERIPVAQYYLRGGLYPFVSHAFAAVDEGQVGLLNVGNVQGTMSH